jgi:2'-5' RNA ligase
MTTVPPAVIRAFVALTLPQSILAALQEIQRALGAQLPANLVRWTRSDQLHLTLKFFGHLQADRVDELKAALEQSCRLVAGFKLRAETAGCFPNLDQPRVIWVGVGGDLDRLQHLQLAVDQASADFGDHAETREFSPHLTIGRVKTTNRLESGRVGERVRALGIGRLGEWQVQEVILMRSELSAEGASYDRLLEIPLTRAACA